ncbi:MAG: hypothetical protein JXR80_12010 [Deltaproteobacteria bacterium]|nr:hypothetical protein [Deltaproteobacteria bacterium]
MTTAKKNPKSGKAAAGRSRRKKLVDKDPAPIDKEKMAAFFSGAGIEIPVAVEVVQVKETAGEESKAAVEISSGSATESVEEAVVIVPEVPEQNQFDEGAAGLIETDGEALSAGNSFADDVLADDVLEDPNPSEKGESLMKNTPPAPADDSASGSSGIVSMFVVLVLLALFWFYVISSVPLRKAAELKVEQGKVAISLLTTKVMGLEAENSRLQTRLEQLEQSALEWQKAAKKVAVSVSAGLLPAKKTASEAAVTESVAAPALKRDSSFDRAPIPFWRQMRPRGSLIDKASGKVKPAVPAPAASALPAVKVDSFSKAPIPFWRKPRVKPVVGKVDKQVVIKALPAGKGLGQASPAEAASESVVNPALDPSFKKAPKPFWIKD